MNERLQQIFDSVPEDKPRSRLEPYRELILRWRRQGRTYRRIRQLLASECQVTVADMTLHEFVQRRSRPRKAQAELEPESMTVEPLSAPQPSGTKLSSEQMAAQLAFVRSLNTKQALVACHKPLFVYDPEQPLKIDRTIED